MTVKPNLIIYRDHLLYPSETFIKAQGERIERFTAFYAGSRRVSGIDLPQDRVLIQNDGTYTGGIKEALYKIAGIDINLIKRLKALNPQLIHAHFGSDGVLALPVADKLKIPLIVTFHGFDANVKDEYARKSFFSHRRYVRKRPELQRKASLFIAVSDFIKKKMIEQGYNREKIIRCYIGVDVERFRADPDVHREPIVLFVGRLVENKGCEYLIRAVGRVQQVLPEVGLVVIGEGPLRHKLEEMASQRLRRYCFLGTQTQEDVRFWMNRARVFSVPSITLDSGESEGFGVVFAEANSMGLPVVSFATGGIPEAVAHGESGFLSPAKDWEGLSFYIQSLLEDNLLWERFSAFGKERVHNLFNLKKQTQKLENIYEEVVRDWKFRSAI